MKSATAAYKLTDAYKAHQAALAEWIQQYTAKQSKYGKKRKADGVIQELLSVATGPKIKQARNSTFKCSGHVYFEHPIFVNEANHEHLMLTNNTYPTVLVGFSISAVWFLASLNL